MTQKKCKSYVLDTNVILHDSSCIYQFEENDVVIPITVLEELDRFKKGNDTLNFHARQFVRGLDALEIEDRFNSGIRMKTRSGNVIVHLEHDFHPDLVLNFDSSKPDHKILNTAYMLAKSEPDRRVILVTKDVNLRMKAKSAGLESQDYKSDHVQDIETLYKGRRIYNELDDSIVKRLVNNPFEIPSEDFPLGEKRALYPNEFLILKNEMHSALATHVREEGKIKRIMPDVAYGIKPRNAEQTFAMNALLNPQIELVTISGKAGTGKTLLAIASALECSKNYHQIFVARPIVPLSNKDIGFLPGDVESKIGPYMKPLHDNLGVIQNQFAEQEKKHQKIKELQDHDKLVISPLSFIRGRSLVNIYFVVDEAQNLTPHEVKTIITRAGEGTKVVFVGDVFQIDHPYLNSDSNGLSFLIDKMKGHHIYAHINLEKGERSELAELASNLL